ncbi:hypothetical protein GE09DRAFT_341243 [Coniochaeta sp. 2T2.1]|nr:hypothetical protein GE09DRAFT_341243 [Coniochaeta sp. 2T2.1]
MARDGRIFVSGAETTWSSARRRYIPGGGSSASCGLVQWRAMEPSSTSQRSPLCHTKCAVLFWLVECQVLLASLPNSAITPLNSDKEFTMARSYESIVSSRPFRFVVGRQKREFMLHAAAVSQQSHALDVLINGQMKEAREDCATWEEVDEDTFIRFGQFAYTGEYDAASPQPVDPSPDQRETADEKSRVDSPVSWACPTPKTTTKKRLSNISPARGAMQSKKDMLWAAFKERRYIESSSSPGPSQNREDENYTEVFLSHAKMFVFANYHGISSLEMLALHKLRNALSAFELYESRIGDVVQLARYSYENTVDLNEETGSLRNLVTHYATCKVEDMWKSRDFHILLETCGDFSRDIVGGMLKRLD